MELEANIFRIFMSLWYLLPKKISKKSMRQGWHALDHLTWNYPMKHLFVLANVTMITVKMSFTHFHSSSCPNYNWENGVKQIRLLKKTCHKSCVLCQLLRTKTLASGSKCIIFLNYFYNYLPYICWVDVIYLTCHAFVKSP